MLDEDVLAWHQSAPPSAGFLRQLMDIRQAIEPKAARWATEWANDDDIGEIRDAQIGMENEKGAVEDFIICDARFHRSNIRAAHNDFLALMEGIIFSALLISIRLTNKDPRENAASIPFHREVFDAIANRDGDRAEEVMNDLLGDARRRLGDRLHEKR